MKCKQQPTKRKYFIIEPEKSDQGEVFNRIEIEMIERHDVVSFKIINGELSPKGIRLICKEVDE